ncbi:MAG TPA: glycosyltransferase [Chthoniobacteraceae bacterium]|jgi:GT2 family glycosyltransferase|nr:glycosyltransferase [Chthoniobacteraceae bacterium]
MNYTPVIATYERAGDLERMLATLAEQTLAPERVIIVDSSRSSQTREVAERMAGKLPIHYERAEIASAAEQRNQGARLVTTPLIAFIDDDATLEKDTCAKLCAPFEHDPAEKIGGVAAREAGPGRALPGRLLWWYYRVQAGFPHPTYGGKLFGPAINCYPCYTEDAADDLIPAEWLGSTCVVFRTAAFMEEKFPAFPGYSFMEDVHLSARIGKKRGLYFHTTARYEHHDAMSPWKRDYRAMARNRIRNQRRVAREVLGFAGPRFELKLLLHRLFVTAWLLRRRGPGFAREISGTWF